MKVVGNSTIYLKDISHVANGYIPQTNIARHNGHRAVLVTIIKAGSASALSVVNGIRRLLPRVEQTLPPQLRIQPLADQSVLVRGAIEGVVREATIAAGLTALMILLFLGSWRSTVIIAVSIPLAILTSVTVLSAIGETINMMTLGGLALAVGILVDDATVTIENIARHLEEGQPLYEGILQGAAQIATPAFVSTTCICIAFIPSLPYRAYALSVPASCRGDHLRDGCLLYPVANAGAYHGDVSLKAPNHNAGPSRNPLARMQKAFDRGFERVRNTYLALLRTFIRRRIIFIPAFLLLCVSTGALLPWLGRDFFPNTDSGQFILHFRAKTGTRIEDTAMLADQIESTIRRQIPRQEVEGIVDNIGLPYSQMNFMYSTSGVIGASDADVIVSLNTKHHPTADYVRTLRMTCPANSLAQRSISCRQTWSRKS